MGWGEFALALAAFFFCHSAPMLPPVRAWATARLGRRGFILAYSALSLAILAWLIGAAARAPFLPLWDWAPWQNHVTLAAMPLVCLIAALSIGRPNPFSFGGGRDEDFDPARPGLVRWMRHPLLVALAIWALAHLIPNGDLAHVLMFGIFAAFALLGQKLVDRRKRRAEGENWERLRAKVAARAPGAMPFGGAELVVRSVIGLAVYAALLAAHLYLFGVSPLL